MRSFPWRDLTLLPERAVWREASRTLFVADVHIGKAATFRAAGLPAPAGTTRENLSRLTRSSRRFRRAGWSCSAISFTPARPTARRPYARSLLGGRGGAARSDAGRRQPRQRAPARPPVELDLELVEPPFACDGVECRHHPLAEPDEDGPLVLAGHLHPAARLGGPAHDSLRAPCFVMRGRQLILPAFGEFTGAATTWADAETSLCVAAGGRLVYVQAPPARRLAARR